MLSLSAKLHFQTVNKAYAEEHFKLVRSSQITTALTYALAELAARNSTNEELSGARKFISAFLNLSEPFESDTPKPPSKELGQLPPKQPEKK